MDIETEASFIFNKYPSPKFIEDFDVYQIVAWGNIYYGFPKGLGSIDPRFSENIDKLEGVFTAKSVNELKDYLKERKRSDLVPTVIEDWGAYNIVAWRENYYGLPKKLGQVDLLNQEKKEIAKLEGVFIEKSITRLKERIKCFGAKLV